MIQHSNNMGMSVLLGIIPRCVKDIMTDLSWDCIVLYGTPSYEFMDIMRKYECHYVCPHIWDDDIADLEEFHSMNVHHYANIKQTCDSHTANSFSIVMSDAGYDDIKPHALAIYLPSHNDLNIRRSEFDIYLVIGYPDNVIYLHNSKVIALLFASATMSNRPEALIP